MSSLTFNLLIIEFFAIAQIRCINLPLYSGCITSENESGLCINIRECQPVMDRINAGTVRSHPPAICSHYDKTVCCSRKYLKSRNVFAVPTLSDYDDNPVTTAKSSARFGQYSCKHLLKNFINPTYS